MPPPAASPARRAGTVPAPPRSVRWFVHVFLVAFVACGILGVDAWPLSGWRLFSTLRTSESISWRATVVDIAGTETALRFADLPVAYRNFALVVGAFASLTDHERATACDAWAEAASRHLGLSVDEVRLYRVQRMLLPRAGEHSAPEPIVTLRYVCKDGSVRRVGSVDA